MVFLETSEPTSESSEAAGVGVASSTGIDADVYWIIDRVMSLASGASVGGTCGREKYGICFVRRKVRERSLEVVM